MDAASSQGNPLLSSDDFCTQCRVSFANRVDFVKHCKNVHSFLCTVCNRKYVSQKALEQHYRDSPTVHPRCEHCEAAFLDMRSLQSHVTTAHAEEIAGGNIEHQSSAFRCEKCKRKYASEKALVQHFRDSTLHPNCTLCEAAFVDARSMVSHVRTAHEDTVPSSAVPASPTLAGHSPTLTAEERLPFRCDTCRRKYVSQKALDQHYRDSTSHPSCEHCDSSFEDLHSLETHLINVHSTSLSAVAPSVSPALPSLPGGQQLSSLSAQGKLVFDDLKDLAAIFTSMSSTVQPPSEPELISVSAGGPKNAVACSMCRSSSCAELVVCMCGHALCGSCFAKGAIQASRCPVCNKEMTAFHLSKMAL